MTANGELEIQFDINPAEWYAEQVCTDGFLIIVGQD